MVSADRVLYLKAVRSFASFGAAPCDLQGSCRRLPLQAPLMAPYEKRVFRNSREWRKPRRKQFVDPLLAKSQATHHGAYQFVEIGTVRLRSLRSA